MSTQILSGDFNVSMEETIHHRTLVTPMESGKEVRRSKWAKPIRTFGLIYNGRTHTRMQELWTFYKDRQGAYDTFYFENTNDSPISLSGDEVIGVGDGSDTTFNFNRFPVKSGDCSLSSATSGDLTESVDYAVTYATGAITFASAPASGDTITATDYRFYTICRFAEDNMSRELFSYRLFNSALKLIEVI